MRALLSNVVEPRTVMGEGRASCRRVEPGVVEAIQLQFEEKEISGDRRDLLLYVAVELGARGIARVARVKQRRVGHEPAHQVLQRLVGPHPLEQTLTRVRPACEPCQLSTTVSGERLRLVYCAKQVALEARGLRTLVKILELPLRQSAEILGGRRRRGRRAAMGFENCHVVDLARSALNSSRDAGNASPRQG